MTRVSQGNSKRAAGWDILLFLLILSLATFHGGCAGLTKASGSGTPPTPPTVSITSPTSSATVSVSTTVSANASANTVGVQFKLDGANLGSEKTSGPFSTSWDTTTTANGQHTLTAAARNAAGQTGNSAPVSVAVQNSSGGNPPVITGVGASPGSVVASIFWSTDKPSDSQVDYGTTAAYGQSSVLDSSQIINHWVSLSGLTPSTTYHYSVKSRSGTDLATSGDNIFTTANSGGGIPPGLGWFQIPNTTLQAACDNGPTPWHAVEGCSAVIVDWNGGIADIVRNRLIVWGGGHNGYWGNEVYSLNLSNQTFTRLNTPAIPSPLCTSAYADGTPSSRHTYAGLAYMGPTNDKMFVYGGAFACPSGGASSDTWTLNLSNVANPTIAWAQKDPVNGPPRSSLPCAVSAYDPNTNSVFLYDLLNFFKYNLTDNSYTQVGIGLPGLCGYNGVIDPGRKLLYMFGANQVLKVDISGTDPNYAVQDISASVTTCGAMKSGSSPGLAYDSVQQRIVGWSGGDTAYVFNPDANTCTSVTYPNGPGAAQTNGTYGRFQYFPVLNVFALVNDWQQSAFTLRLTPAP